jgi:3-hydroxyisobutyrate dehydrogenase-like beta-hydroxyacid dehydrogenase
MRISPIILVTLAVMCGCSKQGENAVGKTGEAIGEKITDFAKGLGRGIDQKMVVDVVLRPEVQALGLTSTVSKSLGLDASKKGITVYFIASRPVSATLMVYALNSESAEIGRSKKKIELGKDDAAYISFEFDPAMDAARVSKYVIGTL